MLWFFTPYALDKKLLHAIDRCFSLVTDPLDWVVLLDGDTAFLRNDFGHMIQRAIRVFPDKGLFTCYTSSCHYNCRVQLTPLSIPIQLTLILSNGRNCSGKEFKICVVSVARERNYNFVSKMIQPFDCTINEFFVKSNTPGVMIDDLVDKFAITMLRIL